MSGVWARQGNDPLMATTPPPPHRARPRALGRLNLRIARPAGAPASAPTEKCAASEPAQKGDAPGTPTDDPPNRAAAVLGAPKAGGCDRLNTPPGGGCDAPVPSAPKGQ